MPELNLPLQSNDKLYASAIGGEEVAWSSKASGSIWVTSKCI